MISEILGTVGCGILSWFLLWNGWKRGFFSASFLEERGRFPIRWYHVVLVFCVYFASISIGAPLLALSLRAMLVQSSPIATAAWLNFLTSFLIVCLVGLYCLYIPKAIFGKLWRKDFAPPYTQDVQFALWAWIISFPLVLFLNQVLDLMIHLLFHVQQLPDQRAVQFLKMTFQEPQYFLLTVITIVLFAPLIEEILFRGFLQSFIRQHLGSKSAILITALLFSLFHYSPEQRLANIPIIGSLFGLALFLGFLYERQGALAAPMILHASFNAVSVLNLYFLGDYPKGL
ncbi:MAG: CPBP family intramembrane metalloprotease [Chlamydiia bacterium]|nr:CPBP family intramembrane metalloprotease [Chlamydiia bacterium]